MKLYFLLFISIFMLSGCESQEPSYSYLIEHPKALKRALEHCQTTPNSVYCERMFAEDSALMHAIGTQQINPEAFGQKILDIEYAYSQTKLAKEKQTQALTKLKKEGGGDEAAIQSAQQKLEKTTIELQKQEEQMKLMLTVAGLNGP